MKRALAAISLALIAGCGRGGDAASLPSMDGFTHIGTVNGENIYARTDIVRGEKLVTVMSAGRLGRVCNDTQVYRASTAPVCSNRSDDGLVVVGVVDPKVQTLRMWDDNGLSHPLTIIRANGFPLPFAVGVLDGPGTFDGYQSG